MENVYGSKFGAGLLIYECTLAVAPTNEPLIYNYF